MPGRRLSGLLPPFYAVQYAKTEGEGLGDIVMSGGRHTKGGACPQI